MNQEARLKKIKVGFRQLHLARGCRLISEQEFRHSYSIDGHTVDVYLGNRPTLNIITQFKNVIPLDPRMPEMEPMTLSIQPVDKTPFKGHFFTDIFTQKEIEVSEEFYSEFNSPGSEASAKEKIFALAKRQIGNEIEAVSNVVSGIIGLRFHFQFVYETINETFWLYLDSRKEWAPDSIVGPAIRILETINLRGEGEQQIRSLKFNDNATAEDLRPTAIALTLLRRAWQETNATYKFINLFTALEVTIKATVESDEESQPEEVGELLTLIKQHAKNDDRDRLLESLKRFTSRKKSIAKQFAELANQANFENRENDIEAFRKFNQVRNDLFHGGKANSLLTVTLKDNTNVDFEHLVERYLNWTIFKDDRYYQTRFRRHISRLQS